MNLRTGWARRRTIGAVVLAACAAAALIVFSYRTTAQLYTNLKATGINPQHLQVYNPVSGKPLRT